MATHASMGSWAEEMAQLKAQVEATRMKLQLHGDHRHQQSAWVKSGFSAAETELTSMRSAPRRVPSPSHRQPLGPPSLRRPRDQPQWQMNRVLEALTEATRTRRQAEMQMARELQSSRHPRLDRTGEETTLPDARAQRDPENVRTASEEVTDTDLDGAERDARALRGEIRRLIDQLRDKQRQIALEIKQQVDQEEQTDPTEPQPQVPVVPSAPSDPITLVPNITVTSTSAAGTSRGQSTEPRMATAEDSIAGKQYAIEGVIHVHDPSLPAASLPASMHSSSQPQEQSTSAVTLAANADSTTTDRQGFVPRPAMQLPAACDFKEFQRHETLRDIFSIQLRFAETMRRLEKSVQSRDDLLHQHQFRGSLDPKQRRKIRRTTAPRRQERRRRQRQIHAPPSESSGSSSEGPSGLRLGNGSGSESDGSYSSSEAGMRTPTRHSTPSANDSHTTPTNSSGNRQRTPPTQKDDDEEDEDLSQELPAPSTPLPSDAIGDSTAPKQVHFEMESQSEYSTPVIARSISFSHTQEDGDDDDGNDNQQEEQEPKDEEELTSSDWSFIAEQDEALNSSVDLSDSSFLASFAALRAELRGQNVARRSWQSSRRMASRTAQETLDNAMDKKSTTLAHEPTATEKEEASESEQPDSSSLSAQPDKTQLFRKRKSLLLEIQQRSAQLAVCQDDSFRENQLTTQLAHLRKQLQQLDLQL